MTRALIIACLVATSAACHARSDSAPIQRLRIATGDPEGGGWFYVLGSALARLYNERLPGVFTVAEPSEASVTNVNVITEGATELAFARADLAYSAYAHGTALHPQPHKRLRGIAVMYMSVLQVVVRADSAFKSLSDLSAARIAYSLPAEEVEARVQDSAMFGIGTLLHSPNAGVVRMRFQEITQALLQRQLDAGFMLAGYPLTPITALATQTGIRLLEIEPEAILKIRAQYPFYKPTTIPPRTYAGQSTGVGTIGVEILMICREDLDETLVYQLTKALFDGLDQIVRPGEPAGPVNPDFAFATPIPLHRGAARYYRERELLN